jgi:hypothetical protein
MTTLQTAAQQALEALEYFVEDYQSEYGLNNLRKYAMLNLEVITALKAALEQHEKDVEWMKQRHANWRLQKELAEQTQERDRQQREYEEARSAALKDDVFPLAREAGMERVVKLHSDGTRTVELPHPDLLERFAALVAAAEREACANLFDGPVWSYDYREIAAAIRARGNT